MSSASPSEIVVGVTGASGLVGTALAKRLTEQGHRVVPLRRQPGNGFLPIDATGPVPFDHLDAVVHLAGEPIASQRWTAAKKARIRDSRVEGTRSLCTRLAAAERPPKVIVSASAVGYYGNRGEEILDETSGPGHGFLADVAQAWEAAARPASERGIRVVFLRFGLILDRHGGALAEMLRPFRFGLGGRIGDGRQYWSWVTLTDAVDAIVHALAHEGLFGPVNVVAPEPVTNAALVAELGRVLQRPTFATVPAWLVRTVLGEMADELLLCSTRAVPRRLLETGYAFHHARIDDALRSILG